MKHFLLKLTLLLCGIMVGSSAWAAKITDYTKIVSGKKYYIGATTGGTDYYLSVDGSSTSTSIAGTAITDKSNATVFTFTGSGTSWTIQFESGNYLSLKNSKDNGKVVVSATSSTFTASNQSSKIRLTIGSYSVQKNNSGTQFGSYGNTQTDIWLEEYVVAVPYTVTLGDDDTELTEASAGAGVTLPSRSAVGDYTFAGWSEDEVDEETTTAPTIIAAGAYSPTSDITLYPVYTRTEGGGGSTAKTASVTISEYATANSWSSSTAYTSITLDENVTATGASGGNNSKYYSSSPGTWRFYATDKGTITISTTEGELTSVTITYTGNTLKNGESDVTSATAFSVSGASATFSVSGSSSNTQVSAISVNYTISDAGTTYYWSYPVASAVERPVITVGSNPFLFSTTATITCSTEGAAIYYSYDEETWNSYTEALSLTTTTTIYAKATKGEDESTVASVTATKNLAIPTITISGDLTDELGGETDVNAGTLTASVTYEDSPVAGATVTWSSNDETIATIGELTGIVTLKAKGSVTFTATYAGNSDYAEVTETRSLTVKDTPDPTLVFALVTDASTLKAGDIIIITDADATKSISATAKTNNRDAVNIDKTTDGYVKIDESVQEIVLENYGSSGYYYLSVGSNQYLYAGGGNSYNYMQTADKSTVGTNGSASISITNEIASIVFKGSATRNTIRYNNSSSLFSCYGASNTQQDIKIYRKVVPSSISSAKYSTLYYGTVNLVVPEGIEARTYVIENNTLSISKTYNEGDVIPAGTGVVLAGEPASYDIVVTTEEGDEPASNMLKGSDKAALTTGGDIYYCLSLNAAGEASSVGFYYYEENGAAFTNAAHKAYLAVPESSSIKSFYVFDETATGISKTATTETEEGAWYTLSGIRVKKPAQGLYIHNGKKVFIK